MTVQHDLSHRLLPVQLAIGFVIWSIGFVAIYGVNAVGCAFAWSDTSQRLILAGLALLHLAALALWLARTNKHLNHSADERPLRGMVVGASAVALGVAALNFIPPLFLSLCL